MYGYLDDLYIAGIGFITYDQNNLGCEILEDLPPEVEEPEPTPNTETDTPDPETSGTADSDPPIETPDEPENISSEPQVTVKS